MEFPTVQSLSGLNAIAGPNFLFDAAPQSVPEPSAIVVLGLGDCCPGTGLSSSCRALTTRGRVGGCASHRASPAARPSEDERQLLGRGGGSSFTAAAVGDAEALAQRRDALLDRRGLARRQVRGRRRAARTACSCSGQSRARRFEEVLARAGRRKRTLPRRSSRPRHAPRARPPRAAPAVGDAGQHRRDADADLDASVDRACAARAAAVAAARCRARSCARRRGPAWGSRSSRRRSARRDAVLQHVDVAHDHRRRA